MLLTARTSAPTGLYVPGASIDLGAFDQDMRLTHGLVFTQIEVDLQLSVAGQFRFTIPHAFDSERGDFFTPFGQPLMPLLKLGTRVWIRMGYGDREHQALIFSGFVTALGTGFSEGGSPEVEVSGTDATYLMTLGTKEHRLENKSVRDAVTLVAQQNGFALKFSGTPPANITLDSNLQTDLEFLGKLAQNFSTPKQKWEFYARAQQSGDELHFRPRRDVEPPLTTLQWGADLLGFKPEINLGNQVQRVEVHGWDEVGKKAILGVATADPGKDGGPSGGQMQRAAFGKETVLELRLPVKSKEEADQRAAAALAKRTNDLIKGEGETFGLPELLPDTSVALEGIGQQFSSTYYVTKTVHRYDSGGYRTRFSIERPAA